ncbi:XRE family transcriptional regulator [Oceaniglobus roseus]|uniref:XRE family transcriptional regulator n=1 Tax=Oceaniglobus roseus TaxID=1737570 RepID=UPI000C7ED254|nr:XRE family transcriptional regulator [Kandeliimicrobium roseum]
MRLAGSRIRARRLDLGMRQADLARRLGISASYLNLIEHNRRQVAGKLLSAIARALETDAAALAEGAEGALLDGLRDAAAGQGGAADLERAEDFAGRFPGWAALAAAQARRIAALERTVQTLNDRITHDPHLSAALHDVLSSVTAIRSTSAILAGEGAVDAEWQARFHRNLHEDSQKLAERAQSLVAYLDAREDEERAPVVPQETFEAWLAARGFHLAEVEAGQPLADPGRVGSAAARLIAAHAAQVRADAEAVPLSRLRAALERAGPDPAALAGELGADLGRVFRRLAALPEGVGGQPVGLLVCDASGSLTFRKPVPGFEVPRFGAGCALWPLYQSLGQPFVPLRTVVETAGRLPQRFLTFAQSRMDHPGGFGSPPVVEASMLILPAGGTEEAARPVGVTCRICPRAGCAGRREPSIVG